MDGRQDVRNGRKRIVATQEQTSIEIGALAGESALVTCENGTVLWMRDGVPDGEPSEMDFETRLKRTPKAQRFLTACAVWFELRPEWSQGIIDDFDAWCLGRTKL